MPIGLLIGSLVSLASVGVSGYGASLQPGDIIVSQVLEDYNDGRILRVNPNTGAQTVLSSGGLLGNPRGIRVTQDGKIAVAVRVPTPAVVLVDPMTGAQSIASSGGFLQTEANGLLEEADGSFLVIGTAPVANITRVDRCSGSQTELASGPSFNHPVFMSIDHPDYVGHIVVADDWGATLFRVHTTTGMREVISSGGMFDDPVGVVVDTATGNYIVTNRRGGVGFDGALVEVNRITGQQTLLVEGPPFIEPKDISLDLQGNYIVADDGAKAVFRIDRQSLGITTVTSVEWPGGVAVVPPERNWDCNSNGVLDACDIHSGTSLDCNSNFTPTTATSPLERQRIATPT